MAWIESHQKLEKSGKLFHLAELLNINRYQAIGHLHAFWWWALDNAEDGDVTRFSPVTVAQVCGWTEYLKHEVEMSRVNDVTNKSIPEGAFYHALIRSGLLDRVNGKVTIHNWDEYTHRYFAMVEHTRRNREQTRERVKQYRDRNADVTQDKTLRNGAVTPSNAPTVPNQTKPNLTKDKKETSPRSATPKERDKIKFGDYVYLTSLEAATLREKLGLHHASFLNRLNGYIGQIGEKKAAAKYKSHYHTILNWYAKDIEEGKIRAPQAKQVLTPRAPDPVMSDVDRDQAAKVLADVKQMIKPRTI